MPKFLTELFKLFTVFAIGFFVCFGVTYVKLDEKDDTIQKLMSETNTKQSRIDQLVKEQQTVVVKHTECAVTAK